MKYVDGTQLEMGRYVRPQGRFIIEPPLQWQRIATGTFGDAATKIVWDNGQTWSRTQPATTPNPSPEKQAIDYVLNYRRPEPNTSPFMESRDLLFLGNSSDKAIRVTVRIYTQDWRVETRTWMEETWILEAFKSQIIASDPFGFQSDRWLEVRSANFV